MKKPKKVIGYGYVGIWCDGTLGWVMPQFLTGHTRSEHPDLKLGGHFVPDEAAFVKCKITVVPELNKRGKLITRKARTFRK